MNWMIFAMFHTLANTKRLFMSCTGLQIVAFHFQRNGGIEYPLKEYDVTDYGNTGKDCNCCKLLLKAEAEEHGSTAVLQFGVYSGFREFHRCCDFKTGGTGAFRNQSRSAPQMDVLAGEARSCIPRQVQIGCELEDLQKAVDGDIQAVYPFDDPVALIMDEESKIVR